MVWWQTMIRSFRAWSRWTWWCAKIFASFELFMSDGWCQCQKEQRLDVPRHTQQEVQNENGKSKIPRVHCWSVSNLICIYIYIISTTPDGAKLFSEGEFKLLSEVLSVGVWHKNAHRIENISLFDISVWKVRLPNRLTAEFKLFSEVLSVKGCHGNSPTLITVFDSSDSPNGCECEEKTRVTHTHRWNADVAQNSFSCAQHWGPRLS